LNTVGRAAIPMYCARTMSAVGAGPEGSHNHNLSPNHPPGTQSSQPERQQHSSNSSSEWKIPADLIPNERMLEAYMLKGRSKQSRKAFEVPPDADPLLAYLTSILMNDGKRHAAAKRVSRMLLYLYGWTRSPPLPIFRQAVLLVSPDVRIVSNKTPAGKKTDRPYPLSERQRTWHAISWMLDASKPHKKVGKTIEERLAKTVLEIVQAQYPVSVEKNDPLIEKLPEPAKKKYQTHITAMINRANLPHI